MAAEAAGGYKMRIIDYSGLWQADNKIFDRLRYFYRVEVAFKRTGHYHSYADVYKRQVQDLKFAIQDLVYG